jgi:hypothetical protein
MAERCSVVMDDATSVRFLPTPIEKFLDGFH